MWSFSFYNYDIKFELIGRDSNPVSYVKKILVPGIRKIKGVEIQDINPRPEKLS